MSYLVCLAVRIRSALRRWRFGFGPGLLGWARRSSQRTRSRCFRLCKSQLVSCLFTRVKNHKFWRRKINLQNGQINSPNYPCCATLHYAEMRHLLHTEHKLGITRVSRQNSQITTAVANIPQNNICCKNRLTRGPATWSVTPGSLTLHFHQSF